MAGAVGEWRGGPPERPQFDGKGGWQSPAQGGGGGWMQPPAPHYGGAMDGGEYGGFPEQRYKEFLVIGRCWIHARA